MPQILFKRWILYTGDKNTMRHKYFFRDGYLTREIKNTVCHIYFFKRWIPCTGVKNTVCRKYFLRDGYFTREIKIQCVKNTFLRDGYLCVLLCFISIASLKKDSETFWSENVRNKNIGALICYKYFVLLWDFGSNNSLWWEKVPKISIEYY